jgi:hypothetical protein
MGLGKQEKAPVATAAKEMLSNDNQIEFTSPDECFAESHIVMKKLLQQHLDSCLPLGPKANEKRLGFDPVLFQQLVSLLPSFQRVYSSRFSSQSIVNICFPENHLRQAIRHACQTYLPWITGASQPLVDTCVSLYDFRVGVVRGIALHISCPKDGSLLGAFKISIESGKGILSASGGSTTLHIFNDTHRISNMFHMLIMSLIQCMEHATGPVPMCSMYKDVRVRFTNIYRRVARASGSEVAEASGSAAVVDAHLEKKIKTEP